MDKKKKTARNSKPKTRNKTPRPRRRAKKERPLQLAVDRERPVDSEVAALAAKLLRETKDLFDSTDANVWMALEEVANEMRDPIDKAESYANELLDSFPWTKERPNWEAAIAEAEGTAKPSTLGWTKVVSPAVEEPKGNIVAGLLDDLREAVGIEEGNYLAAAHDLVAHIAELYKNYKNLRDEEARLNNNVKSLRSENRQLRCQIDAFAPITQAREELATELGLPKNAEMPALVDRLVLAPEELQKWRKEAEQPVEPPDPGHHHLIKGEFQSDKYPTCPRGKVPLSVKDKDAQPLLWHYAQLRRPVDSDFAMDLEIALKRAGYNGDNFNQAPLYEELVGALRPFAKAAGPFLSGGNRVINVRDGDSNPLPIFAKAARLLEQWERAFFQPNSPPNSPPKSCAVALGSSVNLAQEVTDIANTLSRSAGPDDASEVRTRLEAVIVWLQRYFDAAKR